MYVIHLTYGYMTIIAQIIVDSMRIISIAANILFLSPNCKYVNVKLNIKFNINGMTTIIGIFFSYVSIKTLPNEIAISIYRNVQTGPNRNGGGAQVGFISCEYQMYEFIWILYIIKTKAPTRGFCFDALANHLHWHFINLLLRVNIWVYHPKYHSDMSNDQKYCH